MKLGDMLVDMVLYGDICEAIIPKEWPYEDDGEAYTRQCIAATLLKIMNNGEGGRCSEHDDVLKDVLQQEVILPSKTPPVQ